MTLGTHENSSLIVDWSPMDSFLVNGLWTGGLYRIYRYGFRRFVELSGAIDIQSDSPIGLDLTLANPITPFYPFETNIRPQFCQVGIASDSNLGIVSVQIANGGRLIATPELVSMPMGFQVVYLTGIRYEVQYRP